MKLPHCSIPELIRSLQPVPLAVGFAGGAAGSGGGRGSQAARGGTMMFASGGGPGDGDYGDYDDPEYDEPAQDTRRTPGAQRGGKGSSGGGTGGGRQRTVQFQPEERYWTEYLRIALPIIGLLLMIGLFWYWASQLANGDDNGDDPVSTVPLGTTEVITPESTPMPTKETIVQSTPPPVEETPTTEPEEEATPPPDEGEETPEDEAGTEFAPGDFVEVVSEVNMRDAPSVADGVVSRTLEVGEILEVQDEEPVTADDFTWYYVIVSDTGEAGWVASEGFLEPAE